MKGQRTLDVKLERAKLEDAAILAEIMRKAFDVEMASLLAEGEVPDHNLCPPGYDSIYMHEYLIRELHYYRIVFEERTVGGLCIAYSGKRHARIDKIFMDPSFQNKGIGSKVMALLEDQYRLVEEWKLETSSRSVRNHMFYEKAGYVRTYASDTEYGYEKVKLAPPTSASEVIQHIVVNQSRVEGQDLSNIEYENCLLKTSDFYKVNVEDSRYTNSNLKGSQYTDCNLNHSKFTNINLTHALFADLRLSHSEIGFVSLDGAYFHDTSLGTSQKPILFERCDLSGSEIKASNLSNVNIRDCEISGMKVNGIPIEELLDAYRRTRS